MSCRYSSSISSEDYSRSYFSRKSSHSRKVGSHPSIDIYPACQVTLCYNQDYSSNDFDEILIKQKANKNEERFIVYKGYLQNNDIFSFKSQRYYSYPFDIKFYVNGYLHAHLFNCCEYKYQRGGFRINRVFLIESIDKCFPCSRCRKYEIKFKEEIPLKTQRSEKTNCEEQEKNSNEVVVEEILSSNDKEEEVKPEEKVEESSDNETSSQIGQLMAQRRAGGTDQNFFQAFLSLLQQGMRRKEVRQPLPPRPQGNVENFVILLLGVTDEQNLLRSNVNFIQTFDDFQSLKNFLPKLTFEKTILIINESFVQSIEDYSSFNSVYILSKKSIQLEYPNIRGNYPDLKTISERIKNEFSIENDLILIESISASETDRSLFVYSQLLKETMLTKDNEGNLQKDFLDYCRLQYENNSVELKLIDQFEEDFTPMKSIWWFTRDCFVRKMIQRALRTQEVDILFKMRLIIQTINKQIKEKEFQRTVYRTMQLDLEQVKKIKDNDNGFLSFGTFLDCSLEKSTSMKYSKDKVTIQFMIQTNFGIEIEQIRHPNSTSEVLLPFDNIYQINGIEELNEHCAIIELIHIDQQDEKYQELTNEMRSDIEGPVVIIQLGKLLLINDRYLHADYLARLLFDDQSFKDNPTLLASLAAVHHLLGSQDNKQNNHRAARLQFEQSLKIFLSFVPEDNQILSATYNNIGSMYYQDDEHDQAIIYHQKALQCQLKATSPDIEAIATYSGNIGAVYLDQKKYDEALFNYKRSLQILQQSIPGGESASIAMVYDRIASVYWRMERPDDALPYYQKALQMELKFLPENSHKISVSYFNLSTAYAKLNRLDEAIDAAEKSVQQLLKSVPPDHPEVKENTEQLEGLRRRKWLQQLYQ